MAEKEAELDRVAQECATLRAALDARVAASGATEMSLQAAHEAFSGTSGDLFCTVFDARTRDFKAFRLNTSVESFRQGYD